MLYSSTLFWISGRDSPRNNTMAPIKSDMNWSWWVTLQRNTLKHGACRNDIQLPSHPWWHQKVQYNLWPRGPLTKSERVSKKTKPVVSNYINILKGLLKLYETVPVAAEILFVNGLVFPVSISRHVKFTMVQYLEKRMMGNIYKSLEKINDFYYRRGLYIEKLLIFSKDLYIFPVIIFSRYFTIVNFTCLEMLTGNTSPLTNNISAATGTVSCRFRKSFRILM